MSNVEDFVIGEWRGAEHFFCAHCPFDTHSLDHLRDHLRGVHHQPEGGEPTPAATDAPAPESGPVPSPAAASASAAPEPAPVPAQPDAPQPEPTTGDNPHTED